MSLSQSPLHESPYLNVNNVEVIYDYVILVLKGVSLKVAPGAIVALLGANGAGKTTTLKAISNLLSAERGDVTKGSIEFKGTRVDKLTPSDLVKKGVIQVMEGRHCFQHLTVEENLLAGAYTRRAPHSEIKRDLEKVYTYFPRIKQRRTSQAGYTSGGEQQMVALGRALRSLPARILPGEPPLADGAAKRTACPCKGAVPVLQRDPGEDRCARDHQPRRASATAGDPQGGSDRAAKAAEPVRRAHRDADRPTRSTVRLPRSDL